jgi:hypothetical protein
VKKPHKLSNKNRKKLDEKLFLVQLIIKFMVFYSVILIHCSVFSSNESLGVGG